MIILFTASGASGLMLEVVWSRMLGWSLGRDHLVGDDGTRRLSGRAWTGRHLLGHPRSSLAPARSGSSVGSSARLASTPSLFRALFGWLGRFLVMAGSSIGDAPAAAIVVRVVAAVLALGPRLS